MFSLRNCCWISLSFHEIISCFFWLELFITSIQWNVILKYIQKIHNIMFSTYFKNEMACFELQWLVSYGHQQIFIPSTILHLYFIKTIRISAVNWKPQLAYLTWLILKLWLWIHFKVYLHITLNIIILESIFTSKEVLFVNFCTLQK